MRSLPLALLTIFFRKWHYFEITTSGVD